MTVNFLSAPLLGIELLIVATIIVPPGVCTLLFYSSTLPKSSYLSAERFLTVSKAKNDESEQVLLTFLTNLLRLPHKLELIRSS